ncbi:hypothetical protein ATH50_3673 [Haloplanus aerogenes]|uniref:Uncharacterized protein n=1 Tax=Haloplanus aerogenes TaxID=660522 RepID=A0A3M0CHJ0_9EURY|nr:hypothetical protein ATH50_3673 [Haloplanus aerogenes]
MTWMKLSMLGLFRPGGFPILPVRFRLLPLFRKWWDMVFLLVEGRQFFNHRDVHHHPKDAILGT